MVYKCNKYIVDGCNVIGEDGVSKYHPLARHYKDGAILYINESADGDFNRFVADNNPKNNK